MADMVIRSGRVVLPDGIRPAAIVIDDGRIARIEPWDPARGSGEAAAPHVVMAGLVDTHVHVNEPGRTDWEGFATASAAAAAGGVKTIVDMPLNSVPATTTAAALEAKRGAARGQCHVDVGF
jgi:allantoinase